MLETLATTASTIVNSTTWQTPSNGTTGAIEPEKPYPQYVGFIAALVAVIMYGSNFVPVKKFYTGDGMFFQWVLCSGIFLVGLVIQLIQQSEFYPLVVAGGAIWATGNLCVVPIFKTIGMALGMSLWSIASLVVGWATGRFGLFGTKPSTISNMGMNYGGVALAFGSILLYVVVKNEVSSSTEQDHLVNSDESQSKLHTVSSSVNSDGTINYRDNVIIIKRSNDSSKAKSASQGPTVGDDRMFIEDLAPIKKKIVGICLAMFSGVMYGAMFTPSIYVQDNYAGASKNGLDYVFAQFCGIYAASCVYFFIYCAISRNKPKVYPEVVLPGIISGIMWAIATTCWFIANAEMSEAVSYPIIGTAPAAIASLFWGVIVFHEIKGLRNILILVVAFCAMTGGAVVAGLSK